MDDFLEENLHTEVYGGVPFFERADIIKKHIERLRRHSDHGTEHMQLRYMSTKKLGAVDGRQDNNGSEIGSILSEKQLFNFLVDNNSDSYNMVFHTECGYLATAMVLHQLFKAFRLGIDYNDHTTLSRAQLFVNTLMTKPWVKRKSQHFKELISHIDLSKVCDNKADQQKLCDQLHDLVTDIEGTLRYATSHMKDRNVFEQVDGFPSMTACHLVEQAIVKTKANLTRRHFNLLVVEELMRLDRTAKNAYITKHAKSIMSKRLDHNVPHVEYLIEDFETGRYFRIPEKHVLEQTKEELEDLKRTDAKTGVIHPFAAGVSGKQQDAH